MSRRAKDPAARRFTPESLARGAKAATTRQRRQFPLLASAGLIPEITPEQVAASRRVCDGRTGSMFRGMRARSRAGSAGYLRALRAAGAPVIQLRRWLTAGREVSRGNEAYLADYLHQRTREAIGREATAGILAARGMAWPWQRVPADACCRLE